jgi:hypothetical protein
MMEVEPKVPGDDPTRKTSRLRSLAVRKAAAKVAVARKDWSSGRPAGEKLAEF